MSKQRKRAVVVVALGASVLCVVGAEGPSSDDVIAERQHTMESIQAALKEVVSIVRKEASFDAEVVRGSGTKIAELLDQASKLFPEGSEKGGIETWAKPEIWSRPEGFVEALERTRDAAVSLAEVTEESKLGPALGQLGNGCKGCHDTYRRPKE
ncbi:MAG TPA: cytochrome c [Candidatus Polarisedimenticolaceae bacterium]|nr:cytochrome c [Candidatus Polarisedimenticolaceae bacterium]